MNNYIAEYFDNLADGWDNCPAEFDMREKIMNLINVPIDAVIADIGCGKGVMIPHYLAKNPYAVFAVDVSSQMLFNAKKLFNDPRITYINADIIEADLSPVDVAVAFNSYPHLTDKETLCASLAKMVKPGGVFVIAHSRSRFFINRKHETITANAISVPLLSAEEETMRFAEMFDAEVSTDTDEFYFIRLRRKK